MRGHYRGHVDELSRPRQHRRGRFLAREVASRYRWLRYDPMRHTGWNAMTTVSVFGGTGFLGQRLVRHLASEGLAVRVVVRRADQARSTLGAAGMERVTVFCADVRDRAAVAGAVAGVDAVVNAVSTYVETGGVTFEAVHEQGAETLAREAAWACVARFVLVSGIRGRSRVRFGVDSLAWARRTGGPGSVPGATIVRPSAMFGPGDALFSTLAHLARLLPVLPLIGGGHTRLQPVFVEDVAQAIARILADTTTAGRTYELVGSHVYRMRELVMIVLRIIGRRRALVSVPFTVAHLQAWLFELRR